MIADYAESLRSPGLRPVDCGTVPAAAGLLSVSANHTSDAITARGVVDVHGAVQVGHRRLPRRRVGQPWRAEAASGGLPFAIFAKGGPALLSSPPGTSFETSTV